MLSNSYIGKSHGMVTLPNPLLIGLRLTPVSSICFCLEEHSRPRIFNKVDEWNTNHFKRREAWNSSSG